MRSTRVNVPPALLCAALIAAACGGGPASAAHPGPSRSAASTAAPSAVASAPTRTEELFAALEPGGEMPGRDTAVAIAGLDGRARAKATFPARPEPEIFDAAPVLQPEARVVFGGVVYADGGGRLHRLTIGGASSDVATFPMAAQQELSFAASPDGAHVMAVRFSFPPLKSPPPADPASGIYGPGDYAEELFAADSGGAPALLLRQTWPQSVSGMHLLQMVGWTAAGSLATTDTAYATQDPAPGQRLFGRLVHLDAAGHAGQVLGGPDCLPWDYLPDDTVLCGSGNYQAVSIRSGAGQVLFALPNPGGHQYGDLTLAPDGSRITVQDLAQDHAMLADRAGHMTGLPAGFTAQGWLDQSTVVGLGPNHDLQYVRIDQPSQLVDLGFKGYFLGPVSG